MVSFRQSLIILLAASLLATLGWFVFSRHAAQVADVQEPVPQANAPEVQDASAAEAAATPMRKPTQTAPAAGIQRSDPLAQDRELLSILNAPGRLRDRIQLAISKGGADSEVLREFLFSTASACDSGNLRELTSGPFADDQVRQWAIRSLVETCEGFDAKEFARLGELVQVDTTANDMLIRKFGKAASAQAALSTIRHREDFSSLASAGHALENADGFPAAMVRATAALGREERMEAWIHAANLYQCTRSAGCGATALSTLSLCAHVGCSPNSDLRSALSQSLPPRQWAAVLAYLQWIESLKRSG
jgi:hypothetical protein